MCVGGGGGGGGGVGGGLRDSGRIDPEPRVCKTVSENI